MKRLGIFFFYDGDGIVDGYVSFFLNELRKNLAHLIVVCNGAPTSEGRATLEKVSDELIIRENTGFDIWAYKSALEKTTWSALSAYDEILLCNFTVFGPLFPFREMFDAMDKRDLDFWGITKFNRVPYDPFGTIEYHYIPEHLQSNFIAVRKRLFMDRRYQEFWEKMTPVRNYQEAIGKYEAVFTKKFSDMGFRWDTYVDMNDFDDRATQPLILCAPDLLERRCPIIKRRMFFQNYFDVLSETDGSSCRKTLEYIRDHCDYDLNLIWDNLLRTCDMSDLKRALNLDYILPSSLSAGNSKAKTAMIFHLHFPDQIPYCLRYWKNMPPETDFYIGVTSEEAKIAVEKAGGTFPHGKWIVHTVPNRGRDLGTLLVEFRSVVPEYELICFAHDKKAGQVKPHAIGLTFRDKCFENLLGSRAYIENILALFEKNPRLGLLMPPPPSHGPFFFTIRDAWTKNFAKTLELAKKLHLRCLPDWKKEPVAPLGSFFWFRSAAYKTMLSQNWTYNDFPEEPIADDGTELHALERLRPYTVQHDGFYSAWCMTDDYARVEMTNLHFMLREVCCALNFSASGIQDFIFRIWNLKKNISLPSGGTVKNAIKFFIPESLRPFIKRSYLRVKEIGRL